MQEQRLLGQSPAATAASHKQERAFLTSMKPIVLNALSQLEKQNRIFEYRLLIWGDAPSFRRPKVAPIVRSKIQSQTLGNTHI